jgi:hypothetical protein
MSLANDPARALVPSVKIAAYSKIDGGRGNLVDSVVVPYEMSSLISSYSNCIEPEKTAAGSGSVTKFNYSLPSQIKLTLLLDDTTCFNSVAYLMSASDISDSVDKIIEKLMAMCQVIVGEEHRPHFIRVTPMQMPLVKGPTGGFGGLLSNMSIKNEIVDLLGNRVKATVELTFTECQSAKAADKSVGRSSPDLTHEMQIIGGDRLVNKVQRIYGSGEYVHAVAEYNQLDSIRELIPGQTIRFPPLDR